MERVDTRWQLAGGEDDDPCHDRCDARKDVAHSVQDHPVWDDEDPLHCGTLFRYPFKASTTAGN